MPQASMYPNEWTRADRITQGRLAAVVPTDCSVSQYGAFCLLEPEVRPRRIIRTAVKYHLVLVMSINKKRID